jgi:hypothetical protein
MITERDIKLYDHACKLIQSGNDVPELIEEEIPKRKGISVMGTGYIYVPYVPLDSSYTFVSTAGSWTTGGSTTNSGYFYGGSSTTNSGTSSTGTLITDYGWKYAD